MERAILRLRFASLRFNSLSLELQLIAIGGDFDLVTGFEISLEQFHGERIQQLLLHGAFERARPELRIATPPPPQKAGKQ